MIYVYGISLAPTQPLTLPLGLAGETKLVEAGAIAAIVELDLDLVDIQADNPRLLRAVLSHDRVLCELFQQMTILPLRFGTQLASLEQLKDHLIRQQTSYLTKLRAVEHRAEYQIKLIPVALSPPPLPEGLKGRDYFLAKKERLQALTTTQQQQQRQRETLLNYIQVAYADCVVAEPVDQETKVYLLVSQDQGETLGQQLEHWRSQAPHWQVLISEALPPYHFV